LLFDAVKTIELSWRTVVRARSGRATPHDRLVSHLLLYVESISYRRCGVERAAILRQLSRSKVKVQCERNLITSIARIRSKLHEFLLSSFSVRLPDTRTDRQMPVKTIAAGVQVM